MITMNKKGEVGPIGAILLFIFFLINWFIWLGSWINQAGQLAIAQNGYTGVEAFFYANLNFMIFIIMILGIMGWIYFGGE